MGGVRGRVLLAVAVGVLAASMATQAGAQEDGTRGGVPLPSAKEKVGTNRGETIRGTEKSDALFGFGGDDTIYGFRSSDLIRGGRGDDEIGGGRYGDFLFGDRGSDRITGAGGRDRIWGGAGNDRIFTGFRPGQPVPPNSPAASDRVYGEDGNDVIDATDAVGAVDRIACGDGFDVVAVDRGDKVGSGCERVFRYR